MAEAVPASQRTSWISLLKLISSSVTDLSALTAPPFILSPVSLTEFPAYWCEHPNLFSDIADHKTQEERALAVLKWFISTLKGQYTSRNESMGSEKKPLNPVLGELFYGVWGPNALCKYQTDLLVEQVSHHPPITAYVISNYEMVNGQKKERVKLMGHNAQKTSFNSGSIIVRQIGHAVLTVTLPDDTLEEYLITFPRLRIDGLVYGSPYIELTDTNNIVCGGSEGWVSKIEYKGKGYFSGKSHSFTATLSPTNGSPNHMAYKIDGTWHTTSKFLHSDKEFHNVTGPKQEVTAVGGGDIVPQGEVGEMGEKEGERKMVEFESRRLWARVAKGIREGDFDTASREKGRIENDQRQRRRDEAAAGTTWPLKHFTHIDSDPTYERLGKLFNANPPTEDAYTFKNNWPWF